VIVIDAVAVLFGIAAMVYLIIALVDPGRF